MLYPQFVSKQDIIGICAPSAGTGNKLEDYEKALNTLKKYFNILETKHVRCDGIRSADAKTRAEEVMELVKNDKVKMLLCARGGDFLFEILPYIDFEELAKHPKWHMGASDPTSILYCLTTKYDIATLYGLCAKSFDIEHEYIDNALELIQGNLIEQHNFDYYQKPDYDAKEIIYDQKVIYQQNKTNINISGRLIGGCIDVIRNLFSTPYDGTKDFLKRYQNDNIIWFFDNYALCAEDFYLTLLQMKYAGYFANTKAIINGRTIFPSSHTNMSYYEALTKVFDDDTIIINDADIGHTIPRMTLINGAYAYIKSENKKFSINFELK